jgi:hypothetical protein
MIQRKYLCNLWIKKEFLLRLLKSRDDWHIGDYYIEYTRNLRNQQEVEAQSSRQAKGMSRPGTGRDPNG